MNKILRKLTVFGLLSISGLITLAGCEFGSDNSKQVETAVSDSTESSTETNAVHVNLDIQGRALRGYDPVSYFADEKPVLGKADFHHKWNDAKWWFANAENRDEFIQNPHKFAPANGGYCTFGVVLGKKFDGDPNVWSINDGSLHVFLNENVQTKFHQDTSGNLVKVQGNWPKIKNIAAADLDG
jgi:hypothetical protein